MAQLSLPTSIAFDERGDLYIADSENNRVRRIDMHTNVISTVVGNGVRDSTSSSGRLLSSSVVIHELAFDAYGRLYAGASNCLVEIDLKQDSIRLLGGGV